MGVKKTKSSHMMQEHKSYFQWRVHQQTTVTSQSCRILTAKFTGLYNPEESYVATNSMSSNGCSSSNHEAVVSLEMRAMKVYQKEKNETERKMTTRTYLSYLRICERTGFSIRLGCFCGLGLCCGPQKCTGQSRGYQCLSKHGLQETVANNKNNILESCKWVICFQF